MSRQAKNQIHHQTAAVTPAINGNLQRKCACGNHTQSGRECIQCKKAHLGLQRKADEPNKASDIQSIVHEVLHSSGEPLNSVIRNYFEPRFGHDFSQVQVHADTKAAASAQAENALAYTVGQDIVFGAGQYKPEASAGRSLLAHELAHVVQQSGIGISSVSERHLEAEADRAAVDALSVNGRPSIVAHSEVAVLKKNGGSQLQPTQPVSPSQQQAGQIENARQAAAIRTQVALLRVRGIVPPGPPGRTDPGQVMRRRARSLARVMFEWNDPNMNQIEEVVSSMVSHLTNPQVMVGGRGDPECGSRAAYVRGFRTPIILCPTFFSDTPEQQIRTMIHESAHLARIASAGLGESYCVIFDCETSCGGFNSADSWAQFVHCLSGRTPDQPTVIQGQPGGQSAQRGSGSTP